MKKVLDYFKMEFPDHVIEIREGIDLLCQCLDNAVQSIDEKAARAFANRDADRVAIMFDCVKRIDEMQVKLESYSALLDLDSIVEIAAAENENGVLSDRKIPNYADYAVDSTVPYSIMEDFTHKRPAAFSLRGTRIEANDWKDVYVQTCEALVRMDREVFTLFLSDKTMQGRKIAYFSKDPTAMRKAELISGTYIYINTNLSANSITNIIQKMLRRYSIPLSEYKIYLKADYTALHE
ncbi:MAG: hypothetical protein PHT78_10135 [Desulfitobacteriaceae bacterium]|nr:hypothetical protein [Desulfitobacteriaceae bacterium]